VIPTVLMFSVAVLLAIALGAVRRSRLDQVRLARDNHTMQLEIERHRQTVQDILRELQNL
jgi:hypothetical protein